MSPAGRPPGVEFPEQEEVLERALAEGLTWEDAALVAMMSTTRARALRDAADASGDPWTVARSADAPQRRYRYLSTGQRLELERRMRLARAQLYAARRGWGMLPERRREEVAAYEWSDPFEDGLLRWE